MALLKRYIHVLVVAALAAGCSPSDDDDSPGSSQEPQTYISSDTHTRLVFELDAVDGVTPRAEALDYVVDRVGAVVDKPDGLEFVVDSTIESRGSDHIWTFEELQQLAKETLDLNVEEGTAKIHVLYLDGSYESDGGVTLGVAWKNKHLAMFSDAIDSSCDRPLVGDRLCRIAESSVLLHEVGHVLGLVNNGIDMVEDHQDDQHGAHDESEDCVMYWAYESAQIIDVLVERLAGDSPELDFDAQCKADLAAAAE